MVLVFSISNFCINKLFHANNWSAKKILTCGNSALAVANMIRWVVRKGQKYANLICETPLLTEFQSFLDILVWDFEYGD